LPAEGALEAARQRLPIFEPYEAGEGTKAAKFARIGWTRVGESGYRAPAALKLACDGQALIAPQSQETPCFMWCSACSAAHPIRMRLATVWTRAFSTRPRGYGIEKICNLPAGAG
jgi:hypothetical protein